MPSAFEPCGLGQMIAMRYGTLPVVRATGGLADTVEDGVDGFSFVPYDARELTAAASRGIAAIRDSATRSRMVRHVMEKDLSWGHSAKEYESLYASLVRARALA
jgi:starch synthase